MISISNLTKSFGPFQAVNNISFQINRGELVGLLGPNGAGKTTTMRMLCGYYQPTSGKITVNNLDLNENLIEIKRTIGYLPESAALYTDMLVCDYLNFIAGSFDLDASSRARGIDYAVEATGLASYYYRPITHLSKGYKQRVGLAATLVHEPSILILDEPTSGLDPNQIKEIQRLIQKLAKEKTVILSTHILSEVENTCERAIIISQGKVVLDKPMNEIAHQESAGYKIHVRLKGNVPASADVLANIFSETHEKVSLISASEKETVLVLESRAHHGERVYQAAVEKGWILKELYAEKESLENIFRQHTKSGEQNER